jgi:hypothetical protein
MSQEEASQQQQTATTEETKVDTPVTKEEKTKETTHELSISVLDSATTSLKRKIDEIEEDNQQGPVRKFMKSDEEIRIEEALKTLKPRDEYNKLHSEFLKSQDIEKEKEQNQIIVQFIQKASETASKGLTRFDLASYSKWFRDEWAWGSIVKKVNDRLEASNYRIEIVRWSLNNDEVVIGGKFKIA